MENTHGLSYRQDHCRDHPHIHGEYSCQVPLVVTQIGITPIYMGNTRFLLGGYKLCQDHPHIHGEYYSAQAANTYLTRITPIYMGNTLFPSFVPSSIRDHPHIHGEYRQLLAVVEALERITPIYMGNTRCYPSHLRHREDHPHIHGEYFSTPLNGLIIVGSPPYTWGILMKAIQEAPNRGITPIYMGNTVDLTLQTFGPRDHPHIHGEYLSINAFTAVILGSPPYTWGIPSSTAFCRRSSRDHPHIHGEYYSWPRRLR